MALILSSVACQKEDFTITLERETIEVGIDYSVETVKVQCNAETRTTITYHGNEEGWIFLLPTWLKEGGGVLEFRISANQTSKEPRKATATVTSAGGVEKVIEIVQAGNPNPSVSLFISSWEWGDGTTAKEMTYTGNNCYTWTGLIGAGDFKFTRAKKVPEDYWTGYFRDPEASDYWTLKETDQQVMFKLEDQEWIGGIYTVNVDLNQMKVDMIPHMWPVGAFSWGWNKEQAEPMTYQGNGILTWTGQMSPGAFKFLTRQDEWIGYWRKTGAPDYWTLTPDGTNDVQFDIAHDGYGAGNYTLTVNLNTKKVELKSNEPEEPDGPVEHLYLYFWGYENVRNAKEMTSLGENKFTWEGYITAWDFKFITAKEKDEDYWTGYFRDPAASDYWTLKKTSQQTTFRLADQQMKDGVYTINVDLDAKTVEMVPHVWLVGTAFSWGYDKTQAAEMTWLGDNVLQWTGDMVQGKFKFLTRTDLDDGYWRSTADTADYWKITTDGTGDNQFDLADQELPDGNYTIKLDLTSKSVTTTQNTNSL